MGNIHDWINTALIAATGVIIFTQREILKSLKTNLSAIDIDKVKQAKDLILDSIKAEHKLDLRKAEIEVAKESFKGYQEGNSVFLEQHREAVIFLVSILSTANEDDKRKILNKLPKNKESLLSYLAHAEMSKLSGSYETE